MPAAQTGIDFSNRVADTDTLNILDYLYYYNGGGVAIADFNGDGLPDIYFVSNQGDNKLYLNKGNFRFEDITQKAGVQGKGNWKTGVTITDINGDGLPDIYVSEVGNYKGFHGRNELFVNNGDLTFTEEAHAYGLDIEGFNTQAVFFDYDHDGDLDMFLVNHSVHSNESYGDSSERRVRNEMSGDKLFRNDSVAGGRRFVEVTGGAGIYSSIIGYGLNVVVGDLNNDGWDDIYVSNDFHENDYYYLNNRDGTFKEVNRQAFGHESRFSMGSDMADINNDGWLDLITLDMLPPQEKLLKTSTGDDPLNIFQFKLNFGYHYQYARNCLQLNRGGGMKFSDIGLYAGIAATDWSWSPLAADFDDDGQKDLFISNGIKRRPNDLDLLKFMSSTTIAKSLQDGRSADLATVEKMPKGVLNNYIFKGSDSLVFADKSQEWGVEEKGISNGAAYADLDNDGDLDIVINTMNGPAMIYRNNSRQQQRNHYLEIALKGSASNRLGIGAKVVLKNKGKLQLGCLNVTRGFESSALQYIHFGTGADTLIDTLQVIWPDGKSQLLSGIRADRRLTLRYQDAGRSENSLLPVASGKEMLEDVSEAIGLPYKHVGNRYDDFAREPLIPHKMSTRGPRLAVADIDGDGLDDLYVGAGGGHPGGLWRQLSSGKFVPTNQGVLAADSIYEDGAAIFFDANGDGFKDLYVAAGGNQYPVGSGNLADRLYLNDGKGNFSRSASLPRILENKSVVIAADVDHDGDLDLFIGGSSVTGQYGAMPDSYLLLNDGKGNFTVADELAAPGLRHIGMVTGAVWTDLDRDGWDDLVIVGEWMPVTVFRNDHGRLKNATATLGLQGTTGWWTCIQAEDINNDGFADLLIGNWGENSKLHASERFPLKLYVGDLDANGLPDQLLALEREGQYYPFLGKDELEKHLPALIRKKYGSYADFAGQTMEQVFGDDLKKTNLLTANILSSVVLINDHKGNYRVTKLPREAQWAPIFTFLAGDFNGDHRMDLITAGNFYGVLPYEGRYDAGQGDLLVGQPDHSFSVLPAGESGILLEGEVRDSKVIRMVGGRQLLVFSRNDNTLVFYQLGRAAGKL
ncbi:MAG TPA: VCBS repeat-containing protein [Puia sp.]|nr:VCBS repeat-containing protein [Puia sp.]